MKKTVFILLVGLCTYSAKANVLDANPIAYTNIPSANDYSQIVYIDPTVSTSGDGSITHPLISWDQVSWADNTAYLQKRGTTNLLSGSLAVYGANALIGAYGSEGDARPIILAPSGTGHIVDIHGAGITVRDLEISAPNSTSGIRFASWNGASDGTVYKCYIHGQDQQNPIYWGVRLMYSPNIRVLHSRIEYTGDDGFFIQGALNTEVGYCHISKVNMNWFNVGTTEAEAGGDGIQFDNNIDGFHVHHCVIDRSDTGNKFCIIANPNVNGVQGIIENNHLIGPIEATAIYFNQYGGDLGYYPIVRNNLIEYTAGDGGGVGIYTHASHPKIYNNVIKGFSEAIDVIAPTVEAQIFNNTFTEIATKCFYDGWCTLKIWNNIFDIDESVTFIHSPSNPNIEASNNLFVNAAQVYGSNTVVGAPMFIDPANNHYCIASDSAARDTGMSIAGRLADAYGNALVEAPDLGALEYQPDTPTLTNLVITAEPGTMAISWSPTENADFYLIYGQPTLTNDLEYLDSVSGTGYLSTNILSQHNQWFFRIVPQGGSNSY